MKRLTLGGVVLAFALVPAGAAWAQQDDLDVTMKVVPADASAGAAMSEISLPAAASAQGQAASSFGQGVANQAHDMKGELGREFGQAVSEAARNKPHPSGAGKGKGP
jgi:hypothetical protein